MNKYSILFMMLMAGNAAAESSPPVTYAMELQAVEDEELQRALRDTEVETVIVVAPKHVAEVREYLLAQGVPAARLYVEAGAADARISVEVIGRRLSSTPDRTSEKIVKSQGVR